MFEIIYENGNIELKANELYSLTIDKCNEPIERDFFNSLINNSKAFEITNTTDEPLVKLTTRKFQEVEKSISDFTIETPIENFLLLKGYDISNKEVIINVLYQSIYENIYAFNPSKIDSLVPDVIKQQFSQEQINIFNEFLEHDDHRKNVILYNQFVKAIEFAILTSGKGVKQFSENIYNDKVYILDTNIIFRMLGVGGNERRITLLKLIEFCIKQGVKFEYTNMTLRELNNKLEESVNKVRKAEQTRKIQIVQELLADSPHFFNDDFITQYSELKNNRIISSPEQYELEMKTKFKKLCADYNIIQANHGVSIEPYELSMFARKLMSKRKELTKYRYSQKQAEVDAYNILYVNKRRGSNNYNYSEVKSFYLTTDRGLNKIMSNDESIIIPPTILPSQLFAIHNPLSDESNDVDFNIFFQFIKRRTSEFKVRGRDIFGYIQQAHLYTSNVSEIKDLILTFSDGRYKQSKFESIKENGLISFKDFSKTYFDERLNEIDDIEKKYAEIEAKGYSDMENFLMKSKKYVFWIDIGIIVLIIPALSAVIALISKWYYSIGTLFALEGLKYWLSKENNFKRKLWIYFFKNKMKSTSYYKLTSDNKYIKEGEDYINQQS